MLTNIIVDNSRTLKNGLVVLNQRQKSNEIICLTVLF